MICIVVLDVLLVGQFIDLINCDRELIYIFGSIQLYGCLLVCDVVVCIVQCYFVNVVSMLGLSGDLIGQLLVDLIGLENLYILGNVLVVVGYELCLVLIFGLQINGCSFDVIGYCYEGYVILEFEFVVQNFGVVMSMVCIVVGWLCGMDSVEVLIQYVVYLIQV